jgi:PAS domain S-box-containing protein
MLAYGLLYGALLVMAGYQILLFFSLRERVYLALAAVILLLALTCAAYDGIARQYLGSPLSSTWTGAYSALAAMLAASFFTTAFLQTRERAPRIHRAVNLWRIAALGAALLLPLLTPPPVLLLVWGVELVLVFAAIRAAWRASFRPLRLFFASWLLPLAATLAFLFRAVSLAPAFIGSAYFMLVLAAALALLGSLVLADRILFLRAETQNAVRTLARRERQYHSLFQDSLDAVFISTRRGEILDLNPSGLDLLGYTRAGLAPLRTQDLFQSPAGYARMQEILETQGFVADFETHLRRQDGSIIATLISSTLWHDEEQHLAGYQGVIRDVTAARRAQEELVAHRINLEALVAARTTQVELELAERRRAENALERRVQELFTLNEIARTIGAVTDLTPALTLVAERVTTLFGMDSTVIGEIDHTSRTLRLLAAFPDTPESRAFTGTAYGWDDVPLLDDILRDDRPLRLADPQADSRLGSVRELVARFGVTGLVLVPLRVGGIVNGLLLLSARRGEPLGADGMLELAETIGSSIATAIKNARLYQQAQATAVAHERQRLAREMHDSVTQLLYSIVLLAEGRRMEAEHAPLDPAAVEQSFAELAELGQQALGEMRLLLYQLRAPVLKEMGLRGALQQRLNAVEQRVGIRTFLYANGDLETLPLLVQEELYFIAQEALNNSLRHARATEIQVRLVKQNEHLELVVQDNGGGFDTATVSEGMGLRNMQARAQLVDAKIQVHSWQGKGTRVQLHMRFAPGPPDERE